MPKVSIAAQAVTRLALRSASNSRWVRAGMSAAQATLKSFSRVAHVLWLEITGVFFLLFAIGFAIRLPRTYANYRAGTGAASHVVLLAVLVVMFAWFGVTSFWRAKKKS
jgi:Kef-type K+ transport system membrane component KefB